MKVRTTITALMVSAAILISAVQLAVPFKLSPTVIRGDGVGYYSWLRSAMIDGDFDFENEFQYYDDILPESARPLASRLLEQSRTSTGLVPNHWPVGPALMWLPFVLTAHGFVAITGADPTGYGLPYQLAVAIGSATYGLAGLWLLFCILRRYFNAEASLLAVATTWGASSLTGYMYYMPSMSHACSFFSVSLVIYLWVRLREDSRPIRFFWLAATCGLAVITRLQDALLGIFLATAWLNVWRASPRRPIAASAALGSITLGGLLACLPQLVAWQALNGAPLPGDYAGSGFDWRAPHLFEILFAPRYGLLTSTPMFALGLAGLIWFWPRDRQLTAILGMIFLGQVWLLSAFSYYHGGAAFGPRYFVSALPLVTFGLASVYDRLASKLGRWCPMSIVAALVAWNYLLLALYGLNLIPRGGPMSWELFWEGLDRLMNRLSG